MQTLLNNAQHLLYSPKNTVSHKRTNVQRIEEFGEFLHNAQTLTVYKAIQ